MKRTCILFVLLFALGSCFSDDDYVVDAALNGTWVLERASCFCGFDEDFDFSAHKLTFDSSEQRVIVENSKDTWFVAESGTYTILNDGGRITINERQYTYQRKGDDLELVYVDNPNIADDEITLFYNKN